MGGLGEEVYAELDRRLTPVDAVRLTRFPGERPERQPVDTCYVPADPLGPCGGQARGPAARAAPDDHGLPDLDLDPELLEQVVPRVRAKLAAEPVEDLRVDAEDGYRGGPDAEDDDVLRAAAIVAAARAAPRRRRTPTSWGGRRSWPPTARRARGRRRWACGRSPSSLAPAGAAS